MTELVRPTVQWITGSFGAGVAATLLALLLIYFTQDRAAGIGRWVAALFSAFRRLARATRVWVRNRRLRRSLENRLNTLLQRATVDRPFETSSITVEWQPPDTTLESFFRDNRFIIVVPEHSDEDSTVVKSLFLFVSKALLVKVKRFLSDDQREAINLFTTSKILDSSSSLLVDRFVSDFVPSDMSERASSYIAAFDRLDRYALFEPVLLRELAFIGNKVAALNIAQSLPREVDSLLELLIRLSTRQPGEEIDLVLERRYLRVAVVLVGKSEKTPLGAEPWVRYIKDELVPRQIDSVYLLSEAARRALAEEISDGLGDLYSKGMATTAAALLLGRTEDVFVRELHGRHANVFTHTPDELSRLRTHISESSEPNVEIDLRGTAGSSLGTILFVTEDGWGFISPDDPAFAGRDVYFRLNQLSGAPAIVGTGDRVRLRVTRDDTGRLSASDLHFVRSAIAGGLAVTVRSAGEPVLTSEEVRADTLPQVVLEPSDSELNDLKTLLIRLVLSSQERGLDGMLFSTLGGAIRRSIPDFSYRSYGYASFGAMLRAIFTDDERVAFATHENGHPMMRVVAISETIDQR